MSNIIEFPNLEERDWLGIEQKLRDRMREGGASDEMMDHVCGRSKEAFSKYRNKKLAFNVQLPLPGRLSQEETDAINAALQSAVQDFAEQIHQLMNEALMDRILMEIDFYKSQQEKGTDQDL